MIDSNYDERESVYPESPVPDDDRLLPGELPFTAFGQHGVNTLDKRVFEQGVYWVDSFGQSHKIEEMDKSYLHNVKEYLERGAKIFYLGALERYVANKLTDKLLTRVNRDEIAEELGIITIPEMSPEEWLQATPLYREITKIISE